jgi:hypothetical protein
MNQASHFFAPDPGASTLVRYELLLPSGKKKSGFIPDKASMQPRLLYHRHFMLTEFLGSAEELDPELRPFVIRAFARTLCQQHAAEEVTLYKVVHRLPSAQWVRSGFSLQDPRLYDETLLGRFACSDL